MPPGPQPLLEDYYRQYGLILILSAVAVIIPISLILVSRLAQAVGIRPRNPTPIKQELYECGMQVVGGRWSHFNFRYYLYALLFLVFDVEAVFVYPWAVQFRQLGLFAFLEMVVFLLILAVGWAYAWRKGALEWR